MLIALAFVSATKIKKEKYRLVGNREYIYNSAGLREQKVSYDGNNNLEKKVLYFYDDYGNKIRTEKYLADDSLITVYQYEFNKKNQKVSSVKTDLVRNKKSSKRYLYNDLGQNSTTEYIANGKILKKVNYTYNEFGHQTEYLVYNSKDELSMAYSTENKYDEAGNLVGKFKRDKDDEIVKTNIYKYNKNAQISESLTTYHNGKRPNSKRTYTYDSLGRKTGFEKFISTDHKE